MIATDLGRGAVIATIPLAYAFDALTIHQLYIVAFLVGTMSVLFQVAYSSLFIAVVERDELRDSKLAPRREPGLLVRRRPEHRRRPRPDPEGAGHAAHRLGLVPLLGGLPGLDLPRRAADGDGRARSRRRGHQVRPAEPDDARLAAGDGDDQPLQLRVPRALHPVRDSFAARPARDARSRAGSGGRGRADRVGAHDAAQPEDRDRPRLPARLHRVPGASAPGAARRQARSGSSWRCCSSPSSDRGSG